MPPRAVRQVWILALLVVLWPRTEWQDVTRPSWIIESLELDDPRPMPQVLGRLALEFDGRYRTNTDLHERLARWFRIATVLLNIEAAGLTGSPGARDEREPPTIASLP